MTDKPRKETDYVNLIMPKTVDEQEAEDMGAFEEEALTYEDAVMSIEDGEQEDERDE